jgi:hypothetical protein
VTAERTWRKIDLVFHAQDRYQNPYMEVDVWVRLRGPGFDRKIYGFWNGGSEFVVRVVATAAGAWEWESGANVADPGLRGKSGSFAAVDSSEEEKTRNRCLRGFVRSTTDGRGFMFADGTPFFYLADTWWATPTHRFPWYDDDAPRAIGPDMGFKDMVAVRERQGFNGIGMIAAHPMWAEDKYPKTFRLEDGTSVRAAWSKTGKLVGPHPGGHGGAESRNVSDQAKDMSNEGGRPFEFPGVVEGYKDLIPDLTRINPDYFRYMDRKIDYLNDHGFIPFIEVSRRDASLVWRKFYPWPESYARYIFYVFARYHANNVLLSPIHFDAQAVSVESRGFNEPANLVLDRYGEPAFGQPVGTNAATSTLMNFGPEARWLTFHQIGNQRRTHDSYAYLTQIYHEDRKPALNGEPYYPGYPDDDPPADSPLADTYNRAAMYGSVLSGGFAGHIYGAQGLWGGETDEAARYKIWDALEFRSGVETPHILRFIEAAADRLTDLVPQPDAVVPNKTGPTHDLVGWAYAAITTEKDIVLGYFESEYDCTEGVDASERGKLFRTAETPRLRFLGYKKRYLFRWFDPREGQWRSDEAILESSSVGELLLPALPDRRDWGFALTLLG